MVLFLLRLYKVVIPCLIDIGGEWPERVASASGPNRYNRHSPTAQTRRKSRTRKIRTCFVLAVEATYVYVYKGIHLREGASQTDHRLQQEWDSCPYEPSHRACALHPDLTLAPPDLCLVQDVDALCACRLTRKKQECELVHTHSVTDNIATRYSKMLCYIVADTIVSSKEEPNRLPLMQFSLARGKKRKYPP